MVLSTKVSGLSKKTKKTEVVFKSGQTVQDTTASGETEWQMDLVDLSTLKVMSMRESGLRIKPMVLEFTPTTMEVDMKVNGSKINSMGTVLSSGQMVQNTKANMNKV